MRGASRMPHMEVLLNSYSAAPEAWVTPESGSCGNWQLFSMDLKRSYWTRMQHRGCAHIPHLGAH